MYKQIIEDITQLYMHRKQPHILMKYLCFMRDTSHCYQLLKINIGESLQIILLFTLLNIKSNEKREILSLSFSRD